MKNVKNVYVVSVNGDSCNATTIFYQMKWPSDDQIIELCLLHSIDGFVQCEIDKYIVNKEDDFSLKELNQIRNDYEDGVIDTDGPFDEVYEALSKIGCESEDYQDRRYNFDL